MKLSELQSLPDNSKVEISEGQFERLWVEMVRGGFVTMGGNACPNTYPGKFMGVFFGTRVYVLSASAGRRYTDAIEEQIADVGNDNIGNVETLTLEVARLQQFTAEIIAVLAAVYGLSPEDLVAAIPSMDAATLEKSVRARGLTP